MEMDFHSVVMQGPFWSHISFCILTRREGSGDLCVSYIWKHSTHWGGSILITPSPHKSSAYGCHNHGNQDFIIWNSGGHKGWVCSTYTGELAHPPPGAVVTHAPLHPHFLHHLAAIPHILSLWVSQVQVSQVSAPSHIQPIQCFALPCWGPGDLPGSAVVSISARFLLSPSLDPHSLGHVGTG